MISDTLHHLFREKGFEMFPFQRECAEAYAAGYSGLLNAPTGSGKTLAVFGAFANDAVLHPQPGDNKHLLLLWITPLRALAKEMHRAMEEAVQIMGLPWKVSLRTGDSSSSEKATQFTHAPQVLITTPESLHVMLCKSGYSKYFSHLRCVVIDEWHELLGSKRGVQTELGLSRLRGLVPELRIWGISATIGNPEAAERVLFGSHTTRYKLVKAETGKKYEVVSIFPDSLDVLPWAGHLGLHLLQKTLPVIYNSTSTLIFTNTRSQAEIWYQRYLEIAPDLAGSIAMHHGSIDADIRRWVEEELKGGRLKAVVCTSSLDLGVDFQPVESVIQVGSPKGVSRFLQRAGRSGHQPGKPSRIYFVPTHSLELIEGAALRAAMEKEYFEDRIPYENSCDVLMQYLVTLAVSEGFEPESTYREVRTTHAYAQLEMDTFRELIFYLEYGGKTLHSYDEYQKIVKDGERYIVAGKRIALRHRLNIGTIVSDMAMYVKLQNGRRLGSIEESFITRMNPGDVFWFAGRPVELVRIRDNEATVRISNRTSGLVPSWMGGRMPLSANLAKELLVKLGEGARRERTHPEVSFLFPLFERQEEESIIPSEKEFLIEKLYSKEGCHLFMFPFRGRFVHEALASLLAYRISRRMPISFSIAMNDYGFELLSEKDIPIEEALEENLLGSENLFEDIIHGVNAVELAGRKFRDIARIAGMIFTGYPGNQKKGRHIQSSTRLLFDVLNEHEPGNLLIRQAYEEAIHYGLEENRIREALEEIRNSEIRIINVTRPTPFAFPIMVDRLREKLSSETVAERVARMKLDFG
ncbi:MAG: ligase-associated DNA damage response DEXH box helicase [Bacteroidia bacterium]|nr:ligase-associated DNA damage response DEXH box helicase [Bacteroidia bacterium]